MSDEVGPAREQQQPNSTPSAEIDTSNPLVAEVEPLIASLPREKQAQVRTILEERSISSRGPLPPPQMLKEYEEVLPGLAERMVGWVEHQAEHRRDMDRTIVKGELNLASMGQKFAFVLCLILIAAGGYAFYTGHDGVASVIFATTIVGVASAFIIGRVLNDRAEKREALQKAVKKSAPVQVPAPRRQKGGKDSRAKP